MKKSFVVYMFSALTFASQGAYAFDATSLTGIYQGKTPSFLGLFSKPCSLEIQADDSNDLTLVEKDDKNSVDVYQVRSEIDAGLSSGNRKIQFRKEHGDPFLGNFSDVTIELDGSGSIISAEIDQQDQAFIFIPGPTTKVSCEKLVRSAE